MEETLGPSSVRAKQTGNLKSSRPSVIDPGEQEGAPQNNMQAMRNEGKQFGGAEGLAQKKEAEANDASIISDKTQGTIIK